MTRRSIHIGAYLKQFTVRGFLAGSTGASEMFISVLYRERRDEEM